MKESRMEAIKGGENNISVTMSEFVTYFFNKVVGEYGDECEDLTQETLISLLSESFNSFILETVKKQVLKKKKKKKKKKRRDINNEAVVEEPENNETKPSSKSKSSRRGRKKSEYECQYKYSRGDNVKCTTGVKKGQKYCKRHTKQVEEQEARKREKNGGKQLKRKLSPILADVSKADDEREAKAYLEKLLSEQRKTLRTEKEKIDGYVSDSESE